MNEREYNAMKLAYQKSQQMVCREMFARNREKVESEFKIASLSMENESLKRESKIKDIIFAVVAVENLVIIGVIIYSLI